ncbi:MAG: winged helix DNA-binding protein [Salinarimonas sp.]|nr:winged helix DNA-binding protein [Salinarimonas sp.]
MSAKSLNPSGIGPIVSSAHLAEGALPALSEFEFGLILASHAFHRWMMRCIAAAGVPDLSPLDVLILHTVNHRGRAKRLADICLVLSIEETHLVSYGVKKLQGAGLVTSGRAGKEKTVEITAKGRDICKKYREIRDKLLIGPLSTTTLDKDQLSEIAAMMRALSGHYDQAARAAASL